LPADSSWLRHIWATRRRRLECSSAPQFQTVVECTTAVPALLEPAVSRPYRSAAAPLQAFRQRLELPLNMRDVEPR
jgi:hypothetical protein